MASTKDSPFCFVLFKNGKLARQLRDFKAKKILRGMRNIISRTWIRAFYATPMTSIIFRKASLACNSK